MFALFLGLLFACSAIIVLAVLTDSGLRWWSAFQQLRLRQHGAGNVAAMRETRCRPANPGLVRATARASFRQQPLPRAA